MTIGNRWILTVAALVITAAAAHAAEPKGADAPPPGADIDVYFIGNSLTRNIPLERLEKLFKLEGGNLDYGMQLGGGHRLEQHLSMRNHGNKPGQGRYNLKSPYGNWSEAFKNHKFDAVVLQPYKEELDKPVKIHKRWPWFTAGSIQAAGGLIDYARGKAEPGQGRWDQEHPNTENVATGRFYIYEIWPGTGDVLQREGEKTFAAYYGAEYKGGVQHCADYFHKLVEALNKRHPDLPVPVRLIPAGEVMAELDKKIRAGDLPGIEAFYARNQKYYIKSRRNNRKRPSFDPDKFQPSAGILNVYADGVHMNDQPHNGRDSGTLGSYIAAATIYATLTGKNPVGLSVKPYEMFDASADAELIKAVQQTVWDVVAGHKYSGVDESK
jgi:hypothetical protein